MAVMSTLHEICVARARKQPGMADSITEDAPILKIVKWKPSTHGLWNVAEKLTDVVGPGFVEPDAPLPYMSASSDLVHTDLYVLGGTIEVPTQRALKFGGAVKYFAERQAHILKKAGMDTEIQLVMKNWLAAARGVKNLRDAGGKDKGWFLLAVRFDDLLNCGLYDPDQFDSGRLLKIDMPYGGQEHYLHGAGYEGVLGYSVTYRGNFGWQILDAKRTCAAIVNIDEKAVPTAAMIDDLLADVRAQGGNTFLFCSPRAKIYAINNHKQEHLQMTVNEKNFSTVTETWSGIPIITSYNIMDKIANIKVAA